MNTTGKATPFLRLLILSALVVAWVSSCSPAHAENMPDYGRLADSIRIAEGNSNYGVLTHYKHTSYRQACINTCKHAYKDYLVYLNTPPRIEEKGYRMTYLEFLGNRYAPIGAKNDPTNLNKNWIKNVRYHYNDKHNTL